MDQLKTSSDFLVSFWRWDPGGVRVYMLFLKFKMTPIWHAFTRILQEIKKTILLSKMLIFVSPELSSVRDYVITHSVCSMCMYVVCM